MKNKLYLINFSILCLGNAQLFEKTEHGELAHEKVWRYIIGTEKIDLEALRALPSEQKERDSSWNNDFSIAVEARNICECLQVFLNHVRKGYFPRRDGLSFCDRKLIDRRTCKLIKDITFENWPVKIKEVIVFPHCKMINKNIQRDRRTLVCGGQEGNELVYAEMCSLVCSNAAQEEDECLASAYMLGKTKNKKCEIELSCGLTFTLVKPLFA
ncbi:MAG: hypothetical protein WC468_03315 [Candidatus Paceibacterota bacterium]